MKLIKIELENLNSLYGNHSIDFEKDLFNAPLFLIMGATGAGKSTLMDAMCLALFGQTPRLTKAKSDKDPENDCRQIMSKGTVFAASQLVFTKQEGNEIIKYRATWQCERAYKKADGNFKDPRRILEQFSSELNDWHQIVSDHRPKFYEPHFNKVLENLTVEDFKRMVLLAQGEFAAFLKANEEERAAILERLTNTEKYKEIGKKAAEKKREIEEKVSHASLKFSGVQVLTEEQENNLIRNLYEKSLNIEELDKKINSLNKNIEWIEKEAILKSKFIEAEKHFISYQEKNKKNIDVIYKYTNFRKYENVIELFLRADQSQIGLKNILEQKEKNKNEINILENHVKFIEANIVKYNDIYEQCKRDFELKKPLIEKAKELRIQKELLCSNLKENKEKITSIFNEKKNFILKLEIIDNEFLSYNKERETLHIAILGSLKTLLTQQLSFDKHFEKIKTEFDEIKKTLILNSVPFEKPQDKIRNIQQKKDELVANQSKFTKVAFFLEELENVENKLLRLHARVNEIEQLLANENAKYTNDKLNYEKEHDEISTIKSLMHKLAWHLGIAEKRQLLIAGEECPLCGSASHPYFTEKSFKQADLDVLSQHEFLLNQLKQKELSYQSSRNLMNSGEVNISIYTQEEKNIQNEIHMLVEERENKISNLVLALSIEESDPVKLRTSLFAKILAAQEEKNDKEIKILQSELEELTTKLETYSYLKDKYLELKEIASKFVSSINELVDLLKYFEETFSLDIFKKSFNMVEENFKLYQFIEQDYFTKFRKIEFILTDLNHKKMTTEKDIMLREKLIFELNEKMKEIESKIAQLIKEIEVIFEGADPLVVEHELSSKLNEKYNILLDEKSLLNEKENKRKALEEILKNYSIQEKQFSDALYIINDAINCEMKKFSNLTKEEILKFQISQTEKLEYEKIYNELEMLKATTSALMKQRSDDLKQHQILKVDITDFDQQNNITKKNILLSELDKILLEKANIQAGIDLNNNNKKVAQKYFSELTKIKDEYAVWQKLHQLIGLNNGEQFKKFAQILNLEELIGKANYHLSRFEKRYTLAPALDYENKPRLAFAIRDSYHANELRSFKTLSGGETFLVSLALALALADYRTVRMPIETILLDEGFGTLDPSTLQVAMNALESLYATGTQVGIISHVEFLKEAIAARIIVEKLGNGHSCIKVEHA